MSDSGGSAAWRTVLAVLLVVGWAVSAHLASAGIGPADLHTVVAVAPMVAAALIAAWHSPWRFPSTVLLALVSIGALAWGWTWLSSHVAWLYYLQHLGTHLALAAWFGRSLARGREPAVTAMARMIFGDTLSERKRGYTRGVTLAWALFLLGNALVSTLLFAFAPQEIWSVHANLLTGPLIGAFFLAEMLVRRVALPPQERPALGDIVRAYRARSGSADLSSKPGAKT
ncbi:hypothetical protein [Hydrogenophaga sp.]|uniref:COG4648 family protein n=1 Tax=Hydrogenophaga sp. TaxID=1904254 RepID=UPI0035B07672